MSLQLDTPNFEGVSQEDHVSALFDAAGPVLRKVYCSFLDGDQLDVFTQAEHSEAPYLVWCVTNPRDSSKQICFPAAKNHPHVAKDNWIQYKARCPHIQWTAYDFYVWLSTNPVSVEVSSRQHPTIVLPGAYHASDDTVVLRIGFEEDLSQDGVTNRSGDEAPLSQVSNYPNAIEAPSPALAIQD